MSSVAGEYPVAEHTAIMNLDGAVKINTVALSAAQFKEFLGGPTQGTPLPAWVDAAWGEAGVREDQAESQHRRPAWRGLPEVRPWTA